MAHTSHRVDVGAVTSRLERSYGFDSRHRYRHALKGFAGELTRAQVARLRRDRRVALVTPDTVVHALGRVPLAAGEAAPTGIRRIEAFNAGGVHQASDVAVAVIDTGVDLGNPDLNVSAGKNCIGAGLPNDDNGHGTLVSGIVGARNNGAGVVGVAPGTKIYAVKSLDAGGGGLLSEVICGIDWVTANAAALNIKVANLSLGTPSSFYSGCYTNALHQAICNSTAAGISYTVAAGNDARNFGGIPPDVPAAFPEVLAVTAMSDSDGGPGALGPGLGGCEPGLTDTDDQYATFSDYAVAQADADHVVAAPGTCITSTAMGGGTATESGTSFAAPHAAGVIALCMSEGGVPGPCVSMSTTEVIQQVRADAAFHATAANGFAGDPNHPVGAYFGFNTSALDPSIRRIPVSGPPGPGPAPPTPDKKVDWRKFRLRKVQDVDRLRVEVTLGEAGTVTVRATVPVSAARTAVRLKFKTVSRKAKANRRVVLRPRLSRRSLRKVKRSLKRGKRLQARLVVTARDGAKNSTSKRRNVRLRR